MSVAAWFRLALAGLRAFPFLRKRLVPAIESVWFLNEWPEEAIIDCNTRSAHRPAYVCVRIANGSPRTFYPKEIRLEYRPMARFHFSRIPTGLELRSDMPSEIAPGEEREVDFGTVAQELALLLHEHDAGSEPLVRPIIVDRMGVLFPGRPGQFDVEKWRLGRKLSDEEFDYQTS